MWKFWEAQTWLPLLLPLLYVLLYQTSPVNAPLAPPQLGLWPGSPLLTASSRSTLPPEVQQ